MQRWQQYLSGAEDLWILLAVCLGLFIWMTHKVMQSWKTRRLARLSGSESGATYMLPLVLTIPFYVLLIAMIVECTLMLAQKIGNVGAAYAAARAAVVWLPYETAIAKNAPDHTPIEYRLMMVKLAAARAMWPYASGSKSHQATVPADAFIEATIEQQLAALEAFSNEQDFDREYLKRKFRYAYNACTIEVKYLDAETGEPTDDPAFNAKLQLTLSYDCAIHTAGVGRWFGVKSSLGNFYVRRAATTIILENEGTKHLKLDATSQPKTDRLPSLGIRYYDRPTVANSQSSPVAGHSILEPR